MRNEILPFYKSSNKLIVKSSDCYQYDSEGTKYIDFESGVWCTNIGHNNIHLGKVIEKKIKESIHHGYRFRNKYSEDLSVELQRLIGFKNGASVFLSSGSEAVNLSITLAKYLTNRKKILKIDNSYLSAFGHGHISMDNDSLVNVRFNDNSSVSKIDFSSIAALVIETGGASVEMVQFPDYDFLNNLVRESKKNSCLIIADEVTTGMGRLGKWFGFQNYEIIPDIVVVGKALGNGFPISAVTVNSELADKFANNPFTYAQSHQNDPLGCAIGLEVIRIIEEKNLIDRCKRLGDYFKRNLEKLMEQFDKQLHAVRGRGLILALELKKDFDGTEINNVLFESGFIVGFKLNTFRFLPPLTIKKSDIDKLVEKFNEILSKKESM